MAKLHQNVKSGLAGKLVRGIVGDKTFDQFHPLGTSAVNARNARKAAESAATAAANEPIMPIADEEALARARKKKLTRGNSGRASTILAQDSETLG